MVLFPRAAYSHMVSFIRMVWQADAQPVYKENKKAELITLTLSGCLWEGRGSTYI